MGMKISQAEYEAIKDFASKFSEYHDVANSVFAVINGTEFMSDSDFSKLKENEKNMRKYLNEEFGVLETTIYGLMGGKPYMGFPNMTGRWDTYAEALSGNFRLIKGESLSHASDSLSRVVGVAKSSVVSDNEVEVENPSPEVPISKWFSDELLGHISDTKIKALCSELNNVAELNPNATALLMRTILLLTLQKKLGRLSKDDLKDVMNQAISQNIYEDTHIRRILTHLSTIPKTMLDASHHSRWVIIKKDDLGIWLPGLVNVVEATFPE
jgi:hypothetical protein